MTIVIESRFLLSIREQSSFTWRSMLCELIDNSFDAGASSVSLSWPGGKVFVIADDGCGSPDLMSMLTLGKRFDHETSDIGLYGVGCKQALIWLWGNCRITSRTLSGAKQIEVDWDDVARDVVPYPSTADCIDLECAAGRTGTEIHCNSDRGYPKIADLLRSIESTYTPGIEGGKQIVSTCGKSKPVRLGCRTWPKTSREISDTINAAGREVSVRMGIVEEGEANTYSKGFSFERKYRVIKESILGSGDFGTSRIAARITLGKDWILSTNKDDFTEFQEELAGAIYDRCHDLMEEADEQATSIEDSEFNRELAEIVSRSAKATRREKRSDGGTASGTVEPKKTGRKRTKATESTDNPGSVEDTDGDRRKRRGFGIDTYTEDSATFGFYDNGGNRVRLNMSNRWLCEKYKARSQDALIPVVYGIIANHTTTTDAKNTPLLRKEIDEDFCSCWGRKVDAVSEGVQV